MTVATIRGQLLFFCVMCGYYSREATIRVNTVIIYIIYYSKLTYILIIICARSLSFSMLHKKKVYNIEKMGGYLNNYYNPKSIT